MSLLGQGMFNFRGMPEGLGEAIDVMLRRIDYQVSTQGRGRGFKPYQIPLMQPCSTYVLIDSSRVVITATNITGGMPSHIYEESNEAPINSEAAITYAIEELGFSNPFQITFPANIVNAGEEEQRALAFKIATQYINNEVEKMEKQNRIVRFNPIFQGREFEIDDTLVFMLAPFSEPYNTIYNDHIKPTVESILDLRCVRADDIYNNKPIMEDIWKSINEASILISELTGRNPNVFYEAGIAHTIGKEVILITQTIDDVPFDLRHLRCIVYNYTPRGIRSLEEDLKNTIENIRKRNQR